MRYEPIPDKFYQKNRVQFSKELKPRSLAVFNANDIYPISADRVFPFEQHRDIFYLTGIDQEERILIIFPDAEEKIHHEILFIKETNAHIAPGDGSS